MAEWFLKSHPIFFISMWFHEFFEKVQVKNSKFCIKKSWNHTLHWWKSKCDFGQNSASVCAGYLILLDIHIQFWLFSHIRAEKNSLNDRLTFFNKILSFDEFFPKYLQIKFMKIQIQQLLSYFSLNNELNLNGSVN